MLRRILKIIAWLVGTFVVLILMLIFYVRAVSKSEPPVVAEAATFNPEVSQPDSGLYTIGNNWFRKSESGLYELYVEGKPYERGLANGKLTKDLVQYQEEVFNKQIQQLIPSSFYLGILKYFVG